MSAGDSMFLFDGTAIHGGNFLHSVRSLHTRELKALFDAGEFETSGTFVVAQVERGGRVSVHVDDMSSYHLWYDPQASASPFPTTSTS